MVFTVLYFSIYMLTLAYLLFYFTLCGSVKNLQSLTLNQIWAYHAVFTRFPNIFKFLVLNLSGLPPVFLFFIKFNFLLQSLQVVGLFYQFIIFSFFLINMIYYLQMFNFKQSINLNTTKQLLTFIRPIENSSSILYSYIYSLYGFFLICFSGGIFWADFYLFSSNLSL